MKQDTLGNKVATIAKTLSAVDVKQDTLTKEVAAGTAATDHLIHRFDDFVEDFHGFIKTSVNFLEDEVGLSFVRHFESEGEEVYATHFQEELGEPGSPFEVEILIIMKTRVVVVEAKSRFREGDFKQVEKILGRVREGFPYLEVPVVGAIGSPSFREDLKKKCLDRN